MSHYKVKNSILFLMFNRVKETKFVFSQIKKVRPKRLYIACDGPRLNRDGEKELVNQCKRIVEEINWDCEIKKLYRDENLGCQRAVSEAITWFFENEEQGIVLEDDCYPSLDFFYFCDWALEKYKNKKEVWHINGNNFGAPSSLYLNALSFISLAQVWGWASWRDRWGHYENDLSILETLSSEKIDKWLLPDYARNQKFKHINWLKNGLDTWDYQWQITILNHYGLVISPSVNLISNIGFSEQATRTQNDSRLNLPLGQSLPELQFLTPSLNNRLTKFHCKRMGLCSLMEKISNRFYKLLRNLPLG